MIFVVMMVLFVLGSILFAIGSEYNNDSLIWSGILCIIIGICMLISGFINGFTYQPKTEGVHQGVITAVDLEGKYFRRYEVYLKSSGYTSQSDETKYLLYDYETELAKELKSCLGKQVKLYYGHDGGYIPWNSCGTYHIKSVELVEEE